MFDPLTPAAEALLGRLVRSSGPWRVAGLPAADLPAMHELVARGRVEQQRGVYRPTAAAAPAGPAA